VLKLTRFSENPILKPNPDHEWEAAAVFNCGVIFHNGLIHMIYRATNRSSNGSDGQYINNFGYAVSKDGIHFNRLIVPILKNDVPQELRGPEDPRIVKIGDTFFMIYTGFGGRFRGDYRICLGTSKNLIYWKRHGVLLDETNKDGSLFPEMINGQYVMFHRREKKIWLAFSDDLKNWRNHQIVMAPIPGSPWQNEKIGIAGPPIKTMGGWFIIYHGVSKDKKYSLGAALLDLEHPEIVKYRQYEPILEPELEWEVEGHVPNVVFSCGQVILNNDIFVYYGGADTQIGLAKMAYSDILSLTSS
jgi:predicted GH43/DUF377 family glycosyl hydrolase